MADSIQEAKRKRKFRNRILILFLIYVMIVAVAAGVTSGVKDPNWVIAVVVIVGITIIYWVGFLIVIRRQEQKEKIKNAKEVKNFEDK